MSPKSVKKHSSHHNPLKTTILVTLAVMLVLIVAWHILLPLLGISLVAATALTAGIWNFAVATIVILCVATLLLFLFTGLGMLVIAIGAFIWTLVAIALFPIVFPIVLPALLLMLAIGFILSKH